MIGFGSDKKTLHISGWGLLWLIVLETLAQDGGCAAAERLSGRPGGRWWWLVCLGGGQMRKIYNFWWCESSTIEIEPHNRAANITILIIKPEKAKSSTVLLVLMNQNTYILLLVMSWFVLYGVTAAAFFSGSWILSWTLYLSLWMLIKIQFV